LTIAVDALCTTQVEVQECKNKLEEALVREAMFEDHLTKFRDTFQAKGFDTKLQVNRWLAGWKAQEVKAKAQRSVTVSPLVA